MALSKAKKAVYRAKFGEEFFNLMIEAENVIIDDNTSLADKLESMATSALTVEDVKKQIADIVGTLPEGSEAKTIVEHFTTAVSGVSGKVNTLVGDDTGKSVRTIANEELAKQLIPEGASESLDTLQEIAAWIQKHPEDASAMNTAISKLEAIVAGIGGDGEKATVAAYVSDAIAALKIGDYAKAADLTELAGRVDTLEGKAHEHSNKAVLDDIKTSDVSAWNAKSTVYVSKTQPSGMKSGDVWLQIFED
jgi:hypothetical protein